MLNQVQITTSEAVDFLCSLYRVQNHQYIVEASGKEEISTSRDAEIDAWVKKVKGKAPDSVKEKLEMFFNEETPFGLYLIENVIEQRLKTASSLLKYLRELPFHFILFEFIHAGQVSIDVTITVNVVEELLRDEKKAVQFINKHISMPSKQKWALLQMVLRPVITKRRLLELLEWFYANAFKEHYKKVKDSLQREVKEVQKKAEEGKEQLLSCLPQSEVEKEEQEKKRLIILSYYYRKEAFRLVLRNNSRCTYIFSYQLHANKIEKSKEILECLQIFKALGDESRLNMVRLLVEKPWFGRELGDELNLSNSTVSYHLALLESCGFLKGDYTEKKIFFKADIEKVKKIINESLDALVK